MADKGFVKDAFGWGFLLWLLGYGLGILLFTLVPVSLIGWIITPVGIAATLWVLFRKIESNAFSHYLVLGIVWTLVAVACDYFFLIRVFKPADGYYKPDVYLYYALTFALPVFAGWKKGRRPSSNPGKGV